MECRNIWLEMISWKHTFGGSSVSWGISKMDPSSTNFWISSIRTRAPCENSRGPKSQRLERISNQLNGMWNSIHGKTFSIPLLSWHDWQWHSSVQNGQRSPCSPKSDKVQGRQVGNSIYCSKQVAIVRICIQPSNLRQNPRRAQPSTKNSNWFIFLQTFTFELAHLATFAKEDTALAVEALTAAQLAIANVTRQLFATHSLHPTQCTLEDRIFWTWIFELQSMQLLNAPARAKFCEVKCKCAIGASCGTNAAASWNAAMMPKCSIHDSVNCPAAIVIVFSGFFRAGLRAICRLIL